MIDVFCFLKKSRILSESFYYFMEHVYIKIDGVFFEDEWKKTATIVMLQEKLLKLEYSKSQDE